MEGPKSNPGVNLRALSVLFERGRERLPEIKMKFSMTLLEIYNEEIRDLLTETKSPRAKGLKVRHGKDGMEVDGLTKVVVSSKDEV